MQHDHRRTRRWSRPKSGSWDCQAAATSVPLFRLDLLAQPRQPPPPGADLHRSRAADPMALPDQH
ncbi:hypothetical protein [Mycolicibacter senuensis]|uniref:hypothetical protein n=1 Tax=Mycolicibacter senuensis TaxID=386913 RepID=UPI001055E2DF|nr:hypothetical protein [Mycolicibacter senuensis]